MQVDVDTLADFFGAEDDVKGAKRSAASLARKAKSRFAEYLPGPLRDGAALSAIGAGRELLQSPMAQIFGDAWAFSRELDRYCDQSKYPPDKIAEHTLLDHEIAFKRNPLVEVVLNNVPTGLKLEFELKLALAVTSAVLRIQNARIIGARVGDCRGGGKYSCEKIALFERKTGAFRMPGNISFGEAIAIGKPR